LLQVLNEIEDRFDVRFAYDYQLASQTTVNQPDYSLTLTEILESTLASNRLSYQVGDRVIIIAPDKKPMTIGKFEKNFQFSGFIRDQSSGDPLPKATIRILSTKQFTTTNDQGFFALSNVPFDTTKIEIKFIGFENFIITPAQFGKDLIEVKMSPNPEVLDAVMVSDKIQSFDISPQAGKISISPATMQLFSSYGQPDVIRSIQLLPGVVGSNESSSGLSVRGGGPDQNLILFDGFTVYGIDHFFGSLSAFNSNIIRDISLYKSGFGSKYGGRVSSVLDIQSRDGSFTDRPRGSVGVDMMSANMMVETSVSDNVSLMVAGRRSYTDIVQSNLFNKIVDNVKGNQPDDIASFRTSDFVDEVNPQFRYYDINAKVNVKLNEGRSLSLSIYNSQDKLKVTERESFENAAEGISFNQEYEEGTSWGNTGASLNYQHEWSPALSSQLVLATSNYYKTHHLNFLIDYRGNDFNNYKNLVTRDKNSVNETTFKIDNQYQVSRNSLFEFGAFSTNNHIEYPNIFARDSTDLKIRENGNQVGVYGQYSYDPITNLSMTGGLRGTYFSGTDNTYLEPRLSVNYAPYPILNIKGAVGRYYQFVSQTSTNNPFLTQDSFWLISDGINVGTIGSNHYAGGFTLNHEFLTLDVEGFYKTLNGLTTYAQDTSLSVFNSSEPQGILYRGSGNVRGMDVMAKKEIGHFTTWVSYSLSWVRHQFVNVNNGIEYDANQDQRHEIKWVSMLRAGNWEVSSTFVYGSGRPYTGFPFQAGDRVPGEDIVDQLVLGGVETNNLRIPAYHRLDLGVAYSMNFGKYTDGKVGMNLFNLYNHTNIKDIRYDVDFDAENRSLLFSEKRLKLLDFTPSLYFNFYF